jgi:PKD repeat protein
VTVGNGAPVAAAGADASADEGALVAFVGSGTDVGGSDALSYSWDFGDGATAATASASHAYAQDGVYTATLTVSDEDGAVSTSTRTVTIANVAPDVALPASLDVDVGNPLVVALAPTDPSSADAAALSVSWTIVDAAGAVVAEGEGVDVSWPADRVFDGALVVVVADDDAATERRTPLRSATPPVGDTLPATLAQELTPALERQVLLLVLAGRTLAANPKTLRAAGKRFAAAKTILARRGVTSGPLVARLAALSAACAAGTSPPPERPFDVPVALGEIDEMFAGAARAGFPSKPLPRVLSTLVALRFAERLGSAAKIKATKRVAAAVAWRLPETAARNWLWNSILAQ